jgi:Tfp pilus assembly protein PilN
VIVVGVVAFAVVAGWYFLLNRQVGDVNRQLAFLQQEEASLKGTIELQKEVEQLKQKVNERVGIIRELTADSGIRFEMLKHINGIIPENLWLLNINEMSQTSRVVFTIEGMSYAKKDISRFIEGLQRYKKFRNVALESIMPSPLEVRDAYQFIVRVELISTKPPVQEKKEEKKGGVAPKAPEKAAEKG